MRVQVAVLVAGGMLALVGNLARAAEFTDPETGFSVTLPSRFAFAGEREDPKHHFMIDIVSLTGEPPLAGNSQMLCAAGFIKFEPGSVGSRAELNALPSLQKVVDESRKTLSAQGLEPQQIESKEFAGFEVIAQPTIGPDHENALVYMAVMDRVVGCSNLVCATTSAALSAALPVFRAIRDGLRPPAK